MRQTSPQGPTIPASTNFLANFTRILKVTDSILGESFMSPNPDMPGLNTTLSQGTLSNLNDPVLDSQGATYAYAQAHSGSSIPGGPFRSIQYNDSGSFGGSSSFTFNNTTNTLTANKISNTILTIGSNTISPLTDPVSGTQAATKNYVDNFTGLSTVTINTVGATSYSAADMINTIIYRDNQTAGTTTDTLPTAAQIITAAGASVGTVISFGIKNTNAGYTNVINFTPGTGITIENAPNIFSGYQYSCIMVVTNIGSGTEAITMYSINNSITNTVNWGIELGGLANTVNTVNVTSYLMNFNEPTELTYPDITISPSVVASKICYVSATVPRNITLSKPGDFIGVVGGSTSVISTPFIWTSGGCDFYVINESSTVGANLTVTSLSGPIAWTLDPNSNLIIPPGYTGWFMIYLTISDYPNIASLTSAKLWTLGIFPNT